MWFACHIKPQLAIPILFLTLHACLFSAQIKYRSLVLVEDRCFPPPYPPAFSPHSLMHAYNTERRYWRGALMAIHYWKENRLNMTGVCYGELCSRHLYCSASLSVSTLRSFSSCFVCVEKRNSHSLCSVFQCYCPNNDLLYFCSWWKSEIQYDTV